VDGQDFADIDAYGVERWLGELALALREESYQPDPIRRVFIPKANGKLRPLGISTAPSNCTAVPSAFRIG
jgi:RNA-directed DNA polymerase